MRKRKRYRLWLTVSLKRISLFLLFFLSITFFFYILGNFQLFLDSTQRLLLQMAEISSLLFLFAVLYYCLLLVISAFVDKLFRVFSFISSLLGIALGLVSYFGIKFLFTWF
jgi:flagellar biosynthesis protein FlhB